jgi:DNA-binding transcriptional LysR family regulator
MREEDGTAELVAALSSEQLDAAFIRSPVQTGDGLTVHELLAERMLVALPSGHRLAADGDTGPIVLTDLAEEPFILYRRASGPGLYDTITGACHRAGFMPRIEQEAPRIVATLNLVASGFGVTIVPESLCAMRLAGVTYRAIGEAEQLVAPISLACRTNDHSAAARRFVDVVRHAARGKARH